MAGHHHQGIAVQVLAGDEPGQVFATAARRTLVLHAANAQSLALAQGVEAQAHMLAELAAAVVDDGAGRVAQVAVEELAERALANEADAGRVLFLCIRQADLLGQAAHLGLRQLAHRKQGARELGLVQPVEEVALVLQRVQALEQLEALAAGLQRIGPGTHPRIVAGGNALGPQAHGVVEKGLELDLGIAQHVGVGRAAGFVFAQEFGEHPVFVVGREVDVLDLDADHVSHGGGIDEVDVGRAVLAVVVIFPVLHEQADDLMPLLLEQPGGHGGIHAAGQTDDDTLWRHACIVKRAGSPR